MKHVKLILTLITLYILSGCAVIDTVGKAMNDNELAVQYVAAKIVRAAPDPLKRKALVIAIADTGIKFFTDVTFPLKDIESAIMETVDLSSFTPEDRILWEALASQVREEVSKVTSETEVLDEERRLTGTRILTLIKQGASFVN